MTDPLDTRADDITARHPIDDEPNESPVDAARPDADDGPASSFAQTAPNDPPSSLRPSAGVFGIIVLLLAGFVVWKTTMPSSDGRATSARPVVDRDRPSPDSANAGDPTDPTRPTAISRISSLTDDMARLRNTVDSVKEDLQQTTASLAARMKRVESDVARLRTSSAALATLPNRIDRVDQRIAVLEHRMDSTPPSLSERLEKLESNTRRMVRSRSKRMRRAPPLPFQVIGIDLWGDERYAVTRDREGVSRSLSVGDALLGWRVSSITDTHVTLRHRGGAVRKMRVEEKP